MKKIGFILLCCLFMYTSPAFTEAYTDTANSQAGITFTKDSRPPRDGTDNQQGTFPSKAPIKKLPKTGESSDFYLVLVGLGLLFIAKKSCLRR
ncbi:LPXTG cell wall anchor domain-containing protein [Listeria sp. FSL L7-1485]|uniref:LPXTG cell wall anchor domain-containing protein n=1 Tax=Listeria immobilis TaxID=2713502 RepID=A0A7X1CA03_9LIST|nr:LPXTG cell wall anchor domain-containing protein [Listeria immobilis]MBC1483928.1 LPXTG cell wall anchor domain-containing protein [Listeria immobilis]MBC1489903.1 LPXTG cell wall anchor domain-containing protein [Listeria immobilis]MBC1505416.1 LPXTG cell wall anchor domain-containing protein [Listeria immobilis]MBC1509151.1 LPXTG cell wall anchor domain-containing protein [Listeria immobilis]MBC1514564.1 LPXTG cell wall anchor domain-containing protein [Listeria immobilis]